MTYQNPLEDRRVLLTLELGDIESRCEDLKIDIKNVDTENVFYLMKKGIEFAVMDDLYWECLAEAIESSVKK
jgi:hypothetical protein